MDALADDRLGVDCVLHCMDEGDLEAIMAVPWVSVCTDGEARRPGHPVLDRGVPHPRAYGSTPRVLGHYVRERSVLGLETAVAKLSSVPAARVGLADRGLLRVGWKADVVVFDPATVIDTATYERPARLPGRDPGRDRERARWPSAMARRRASVRDGSCDGARDPALFAAPSRPPRGAAPSRRAPSLRLAGRRHPVHAAPLAAGDAACG